MSDDRLRPPPEWMARKARRERGPGADMSNERTGGQVDQVSASEQADMRFYMETLDGVDTSGLTDEQVLEYIEQNASSGSMAYVHEADR